jgi:hypothetical protein
MDILKADLAKRIDGIWNNVMNILLTAFRAGVQRTDDKIKAGEQLADDLVDFREKVEAAYDTGELAELERVYSNLPGFKTRQDLFVGNLKGALCGT